MRGLPSLSMVLLKAVPVLTRVSTWFLSMARYYPIVRLNPSTFIQPPTGGRWACVHGVMMASDAAVDISTRGFMWMCVFISIG